VRVESFVALQADEARVADGGERLGDLGLADAGVAFGVGAASASDGMASAVGATAAAATWRSFAFAAKLVANCCRICSATGTASRPPKVAALPLIDTSLVPTRLEASPTSGSTRAVRSIDAPEPPVVSVPLPSKRKVRAGGSTDTTSTSPRNVMLAGPKRTATVPL